MRAAGVAHEINNPLAAVITNISRALAAIEALGERFGHIDELEDELEVARDAAERVRRIVRDLVISSREEEESPGVVHVQSVMTSTLRIARNEIRDRARLVEDYAEGLHVRANETRLGQVFLNILVNAAQAIPEGHPDANEIRVSTRRNADGQVVVAIADTGTGISKEVEERLFTPFVTTKPAGRGTGLGLSICRRIVDEIGGRISVESSVGVGTVFEIFLPAADVRADSEPEPEARLSGLRVVTASRRGRVLVVDDEPMIGHVVRQELEPEHDVITSTSADEALEKIHAGERFDVILCDLMMPEMTGMDLHAALQRVAPDLVGRMIFLTGGAFTKRARSFLDRTPSSSVEKPFDWDHLRALVNQKIR